MKRFTTSLLLLALVAAPAAAKTRVIVLPPTGSAIPELKTELAQSVVGLPAGDSLVIYASWPSVAPIATITRPTDASLNKARITAALAAQFKPVLDYIASALPASNAEPPFLIPQIIEQLAGELPGFAEKGGHVLLIGPWLYRDHREMRTAMLGAVPSDTTMRSPRGEWPYSVVGAETRLAQSALFFCWPGGANAFENDRYQYRVMRFWRVWTKAQSGKVGVMSFSLKSCFARFNAGDTSGQPDDAIQREGKPEMQRVSEAVPLVLPASFENPGLYFLRDDVPLAKTPPTATKGAMYIGIRWSTDCDLDLYSRADPQSQWVNFSNTKVPGGVFSKDWLGAPGDGQYETIFFNQVKLNDLDIAANLYSCSATAPPEGKLRIWFEGRVWEVPFSFGARTGNKGAQPMTGGAWVRFGPLLKLLGKE